MLTPYQSIVSLTPLVSSAHPHLARQGLLLRSIVTTAIETIVSGLVCGTVSVTKSRGSAISFDSRVTKLVRAASILQDQTVQQSGSHQDHLCQAQEAKISKFLYPQPSQARLSQSLKFRR